MKQKIKSLLTYIFEPNIIIFALAAYSFISLWQASNIFIGIACVACPWYFDWNYTNDPSLLFLATSFLLFNKWWGNLVSSVLSGYVLVKGVYLILILDLIEWLEYLPIRWKFIQEYEIDILKEWEIQLILAVIVFSLSIFYLVQDMKGSFSIQLKPPLHGGW